MNSAEQIESETLLSVPEAAEFLGVSTMTVWRKLGFKNNPRQLGCYRFGNRVLVSKERHLIPFLHRNEQVPPEPTAFTDSQADR